MDMPQFTAEASLYKAGEYYQTGRPLNDLPPQMIRVISPAAIKNDGVSVNCDTCIGAQCVELHCLEKMIHPGGDLGVLNPGGGGGGGGNPTTPCISYDLCSACIPTGPSLFSGGRKFCQSFTCQTTSSGACSCQVYAKGYQSCNPVEDRTTTQGQTRFTRG